MYYVSLVNFVPHSSQTNDKQFCFCQVQSFPSPGGRCSSSVQGHGVTSCPVLFFFVDFFISRQRNSNERCITTFSGVNVVFYEDVHRECLIER